MLMPQNNSSARLYTGLYLRTTKQTRFWGWSSRGWGKLNTAAAKPSVQNLGEWLRQAHLQLDRQADELPATSDMQIDASAEQGAPAQPRRGRKFEFVCNRRFVGFVIR